MKKKHLCEIIFTVKEISLIREALDNYEVDLLGFRDFVKKGKVDNVREIIKEINDKIGRALIINEYH